MYLFTYHTFHLCIYVKYNEYNDKPARAYTDKSMSSSVIAGGSENSKDIQLNKIKKMCR